MSSHLIGSRVPISFCLFYGHHATVPSLWPCTWAVAMCGITCCYCLYLLSCEKDSALWHWFTKNWFQTPVWEQNSYFDIFNIYIIFFKLIEIESFILEFLSLCGWWVPGPHWKWSAAKGRQEPHRANLDWLFCCCRLRYWAQITEAVVLLCPLWRRCEERWLYFHCNAL